MQHRYGWTDVCLPSTGTWVWQLKPTCAADEKYKVTVGVRKHRGDSMFVIINGGRFEYRASKKKATLHEKAWGEVTQEVTLGDCLKMLVTGTENVTYIRVSRDQPLAPVPNSQDLPKARKVRLLRHVEGSGRAPGMVYDRVCVMGPHKTGTNVLAQYLHEFFEVDVQPSDEEKNMGGTVCLDGCKIWKHTVPRGLSSCVAILRSTAESCYCSRFATLCHGCSPSLGSLLSLGQSCLMGPRHLGQT